MASRKSISSSATGTSRPTSCPLTGEPKSRHRGFTLLEAAVALALFATVGMALYTLYNTNLITLLRVQDSSRQVPVVRHAIEYLATVNPAEQQEGEFAFNGFDVRWQASLVEPTRKGQNAFGLVGYYDIGLYDVRFEITEEARPDGRVRPVGSWNLRLVGYEDVRGPPPELFSR